jgi:mannose-6-phosphate isomerase-like protein (cupin superfamily)
MDAQHIEHVPTDRQRTLELQQGVKLRYLGGGCTRAVYLVEVAAGTSSTSSGHDGDELRYVISGKVTFCVGDREIDVMAGGALCHSCASPHSFRTGDRPATFLTVALPRHTCECLDLADLARGVPEGDVGC